MDDTENTKKRVAVYMRFGYPNAGQILLYEQRKREYKELIDQKADWELKDFYIDEGVSGSTLKNRKGFERMIEDCRAGEIDLIVTGKISDICRNIVDCIECIRELKAMDPPVGIFFKTENLYTLDDKSDELLSIVYSYYAT